ncbi:hypothetical protein [Planomicrobium sp. MB-3u-38]|uniref:hypothetical protein n=1 Tax=Planomicrobium sp. MB-3u-38 TaxID=2058318 RepID=UPI000C7B432F|nr:hypothetical protein [Planomicrobium sp. MB-3u-38]PKH12113.1 hypothetical protein CXF70_01005 [Planomicrobium sp. MB-3u-38]
MKHLKGLIAIAVLAITLAGCSSNDEVIRIGTPFQEDETSGVKFHTDITNTESITDLRDIMNTEKEVEQPADLSSLADTFFTLDIREEGVSEISRYVWYQEDGSTILSNDDLAGNEDQNFFILTADQTEELKHILGE